MCASSLSSPPSLISLIQAQVEQQRDANERGNELGIEQQRAGSGDSEVTECLVQ
ncbi:hypothetical protein Dimus_013614, partial [Dionaea muscipula]